MSLAYIPAPAAYLIGVKRVSILFSMILVVATPRTTFPVAACGCYGHDNPQRIEKKRPHGGEKFHSPAASHELSFFFGGIQGCLYLGFIFVGQGSFENLAAAAL